MSASTEEHKDKDSNKTKKPKAEKIRGASQMSQSVREVRWIVGGGLNESEGSFGDLLLVQSSFEDSRHWLSFSELVNSSSGSSGWLRGRVSTARGKGKFAFVVVRRGVESVQCVISDGVGGMSRDAVKWCTRLPSESVIDVYGEIVKVEVPTKTTASEVEIKVSKIFVVSLAATTLPFQLGDAAKPVAESNAAAAVAGSATPQASSSDSGSSSCSSSSGVEAGGGSGVVEENGVITVGQDIRLDNRWIDLRTPANHAIFRIQSRVCQYYRQFFIDRDFIEIHTPKLTPGVSEGGAAVFRLKYFNTDACLAQSPQLYKQMAVTSDLFRVFEIGPVFRAETSNTHRHMCEFTGLDFEMEIKQHYHEVLKTLSDLFVFIFDQLKANCEKELAAVNAQYPFTPLKYNPETLVIPFSQAVTMLRGGGEEIGDEEDFSTPQEKKLGRLVKEAYDVDFYIVDQYPLTARPFYTMPNKENPRFTNSYDVFVRGEEITSGAQRVHDAELLVKRAAECGIPADNIKDYVESFKYGAWPHGGAGIGLERVVMLYLGLDNIRKTALFPRTPNRISP